MEVRAPQNEKSFRKIRRCFESVQTLLRKDCQPDICLPLLHFTDPVPGNHGLVHSGAPNSGVIIPYNLSSFLNFKEKFRHSYKHDVTQLLQWHIAA